MTILTLTVLTALMALGLLALLIVDVLRLVRQLEPMGGVATGHLAKIRFDVRAIESETSQLEPHVIALSKGLRAVNGSLRTAERDLTQALTRLRS